MTPLRAFCASAQKERSGCFCEPKPASQRGRVSTLVKLLMVCAPIVLGASGCLTLKQDFTGPGYCRRYVVYPPQHVDEMVSDKIAHDWMSAALPTLRGGCDGIIKYNHSKDYFSLLNIDHQAPPQDHLTDTSLHFRLHERLFATHIVILTATENKDSIQIKTTVNALSPYKEDSLRRLPAKIVMTLQQTATINRIRTHPRIVEFLHLIPNSFSVGYTSSSGVINERINAGQVHEYSEKDRSVLPRIASSIIISNIRHRYGYALFDVSLEGFSSFVIRNTDTSYELTQIPPNVAFNPDTVPPNQRITYNLYSILIAQVFGGQLSAYTPIGTFFINISVGPGVDYTVDSIQNRQTKVVAVAMAELGYRAFCNDHVYVQYTSNATSPMTSQINNPYFNYQSNFFVSLAVGYYFPQVRSLARAAL